MELLYQFQNLTWSRLQTCVDTSCMLSRATTILRQPFTAEGQKADYNPVPQLQQHLILPEKGVH